MIIKKVSFTSASIKRIAVDDNDEELKNSVILDLLSQPNPDQSQIEFLEEIGESFNSTGNAYIRHIQGIGAGNELQTGNYYYSIEDYDQALSVQQLSKTSIDLVILTQQTFELIGNDISQHISLLAGDIRPRHRLTA